MCAMCFKSLCQYTVVVQNNGNCQQQRPAILAPFKAIKLHLSLNSYREHMVFGVKRESIKPCFLETSIVVIKRYQLNSPSSGRARYIVGGAFKDKQIDSMLKEVNVKTNIYRLLFLFKKVTIYDKVLSYQSIV